MRNDFERHSWIEFPALLTLIIVVYLLAIQYVGLSASLRTIQKINSEYDLDWLTWRRCASQRGQCPNRESAPPPTCDFGNCLLDDQ